MSVTRRAALAAAAALLAGVVAPHARAQAQPAEATRMDAAQALKLAAAGEAVIVDVREKLAFDGSHAEGARSIPLAEIATRMSELPKDKLIAAYCT
jgi:hypothetical protein